MSSSPLSVVNHPMANFQPSLWGDRFLNITLPDEVTTKKKEQEVRHLKEKVKEELLTIAHKPIEHLELIDAIERLGVGYHFEKQIEEALQQVFQTYRDQCDKDDLFHVALRFRVLRQHGFFVECDVFKRFKNEKGGFDNAIGKNDVRGILSLYEASHVRVHGDNILDEALAFTTTYLKSVANKLSSPLAEEVEHALHQPLHKGIIRLESRHYISFYEQYPLHNKTLLKLAKLDFNLLQSLHQKEMRDFEIWWKGVHAKLPFTRDRSAEVYLWALGSYYEPQYSLARKIFNKIVIMLQVLDDVHDAYGDVAEAELLNDAVDRWDPSCAADLPGHFNYCYQALLETIDEAEQELAREGRSFCIRYAKEQIKRNCDSWLQEARWRHQKYIPTYEEHIEVAIVSIGHIVGVIASYFGMGEIATKEAYEWVCQEPMPKLVRASSVILRLMNDIAGHKFEQSRDHVPSSVECYMKQHGILDEEEVYELFENKVEEAWKDVNEAILRPYVIPKPLVDRLLNFARVPEVMYKNRVEGYTAPDETMKRKIASLLIDPIPM